MVVMNRLRLISCSTRWEPAGTRYRDDGRIAKEYAIGTRFGVK
jgi:hypothetical protein